MRLLPSDGGPVDIGRHRLERLCAMATLDRAVEALYDKRPKKPGSCSLLHRMGCSLQFKIRSMLPRLRHLHCGKLLSLDNVAQKKGVRRGNGAAPRITRKMSDLAIQRAKVEQHSRTPCMKRRI